MNVTSVEEQMISLQLRTKLPRSNTKYTVPLPYDKSISYTKVKTDTRAIHHCRNLLLQYWSKCINDSTFPYHSLLAKTYFVYLASLHFYFF